MHIDKRLLELGAIVLVIGVTGMTGWQLHRHWSGADTPDYQAPIQTSQGLTASENKPKGKRTRVTRYLLRHHFVGSALVVKNGHIIYQQGFGYANAVRPTPNDSQSQYQILSIQKSLTAAMVMKLISEQRLRMTTPLSRFYPQIKNARNVTVKQLLNMTSGLSLDRNSKTPLSEKQVVAYDVKHLESHPKLAGQWRYEPVNYVLLAGIVTKLTHRSYTQNFNATFKKPLHLTHTGFVQQWGHRVFRTTSYHHVSSNQLTPNYQRVYHESRAAMQNELGTGQLYMTTTDLFRAEQQLLSGKVISRQAISELHQAGSVSTYGGGVYNQSNGIRLHGIGYGYESAGLLTRDGKSGVVLLSNDYRKKASVLPLAKALFKKVAG